MRRWTLAAATLAVFGAALWHLPATAQLSPPPQEVPTSPLPATAAETSARPDQPKTQPITFDEYRDFRLRDIAQRRARLAHELADTGLSAAVKANLEGRKAYYDRLATMPPADRDRIFRARFDQIDANHDGLLDLAERAAWHAKRREYYRELAVARDEPAPAGAKRGAGSN